MTPDQRALVHGLVIEPPSGKRKVSKEEFAAKFPDALEDGKLSLKVLIEASEEKNAEDLGNALTIGHVFGFPPDSEEILYSLASQVWHYSHEGVVAAIARTGFSDDRAIDALYDATQTTPSYLDYDDSRALAVQAIWALGKIPGRHSEQRLEMLARSPVTIIRQNAKKQLERRRGAD